MILFFPSLLLLCLTGKMIFLYGLGISLVPAIMGNVLDTSGLALEKFVKDVGGKGYAGTKEKILWLLIAGGGVIIYFMIFG